ncbi:MAG: leucyl/phenylalanyl-tRNA--protein transferase [Melioribacter sp.]|uniref:leucyl/phenylalanyl-tRNA--protein transferase n=1 Tax=Rosettibacter primus TaxID=3111523 RepID=UPI00247D0D80|nr:leucyl/phenylalanyl-tRNA--protein transferase [Melioribacter sp.]
MNEQRIISKKNLLKPENMIQLYAQGAFPMADDDGNIEWYLPEIRTIIPLDNYNIPRSLRKFMEKSNFEYKIDSKIIEVIINCSKRPKTWISEELIEAYKGLIKLGYLHSVEVYQNNELVGGLYGVTYRGAFFGESMFSKVSQASKCALVRLIEHLNKKEFVLLDVQFQTEHLRMFGAVEISFDEYTELLLRAHEKKVNFN